MTSLPGLDDLDVIEDEADVEAESPILSATIVPSPKPRPWRKRLRLRLRRRFRFGSFACR